MKIHSMLAAALVFSSTIIAADLGHSDRWQPLGYEIPDVRVVDQDGHARRFYTDLVKGQTVGIQFIFTSCATICTPLGATFHALQSLAPQGDPVRLISISVDPERDTSAELRHFADRFGARSGWTLVTGEPVEIERLLKSLRAFTQDKSAHSAMILIGNDRIDRWTRAYGLSPAKSLAALLRQAAMGAE